MHRPRRRSPARLVPALAAAGLFLAPFAVANPRTDGASGRGASGSLRGGTASLAVPFHPNHGQWSSEVAFKADHFAGTFWVTTAGALVVSLLGPPRAADPGEDVGARARGWSVVERFVDGRPSPARGVEKAPTRVSYFLGADPAKWRRDLPTWRALTFGQVWPGIEVRLAAHGQNVERLFLVAPGADPAAIEMELGGALDWRLGAAGELVVGTGHGDIALSAPVAFQVVDGKRTAVEVHYRPSSRGYGFRLGAYDPTRELVIDPVLQSTYVGGSSSDQALGVALNSAGEVIVTGGGTSSDFPGSAGGAQESLLGTSDMLVARLSRDLTTLLSSSYLGGSGSEFAEGVALSDDDDVFVFGATGSADYPGTAGGAQPNIAGSNDGVIARLSPDLTTLRQSTYLGGSGYDNIAELAVSSAGDLFTIGASVSTDFPATTGGAQADPGGASDIVVARVSGDLTNLAQGSYLGGAGSEYGLSIALADDGGVLVTGYAESTDYPGTAGGAQESYAGEWDIVVSRLSGALTTLVQSTFLGGTAYEEGHGVAVDGAGNVVVLGSSESTDYPATSGGAQPNGGGSQDLVVSLLNGALTTLLQSTYVGGEGYEYPGGVAVDDEGYVLVVGGSDSADYPGSEGATQESNGGAADAVLSRLQGDLTTLSQSTYLGGSGDDTAYALTTDGADVVVAGGSASSDLPATANGAQAQAAGADDVLISRVSGDLREEPLCDDLLHGGAPCDAPLVCGDGLLDDGEGCDDGDAAGEDGCDASCAVEEGYVCEGEPSVCAQEATPMPPDHSAPEGCGCSVGAGAERLPTGRGVWLLGLSLALLLRPRGRVVRQSSE